MSPPDNPHKKFPQKRQAQLKHAWATLTKIVTWPNPKSIHHRWLWSKGRCWADVFQKNDVQFHTMTTCPCIKWKDFIVGWQREGVMFSTDFHWIDQIQLQASKVRQANLFNLTIFNCSQQLCDKVMNSWNLLGQSASKHSRVLLCGSADSESATESSVWVGFQGEHIESQN